ncbi:MAG TPA: cytochrome P450 [Acidimicrobiales bacterium]|nr:cytochrome P450 [Acidimicrobiales bacterium]
MGAADVTGVDLTDLDVFVDGFPHDVFTDLRRRAPVWWHEPTTHTPDGVGFWVVSGAPEVLAAVADAATFSSERAPGAAGGGTLIQDLPHGFAAGVLLNMTDDPRHQEVRRVVTPSVAPRALAALEPELRRRAAALFDAVDVDGRCDFLTDVAVELPLQATATLLGVPQEDRHDLMAWSNATLDYEDRELGESSPAAEAAAAASADYGSRLVARRRAEGGTDMLSVLAAAELGDGQLSELELFMSYSLMIAAGSETTRNAIALGLEALVVHEDQWRRLQREPALVESATEEILRWTSPTLYNRRTATRDTELAGVPVAAGDKVTLWWASANRDERIFDDPFRFDVGRRPNPHLAFGYRSHFCLGANLARLEIRIVLEELRARYDGFELTGPVERFRTNKHAGVKHMPVVLHRRP